MIQQLLGMIRSMVAIGKVNRPGASPQVTLWGERVSEGVEVREPQGLHFVAPAEARGVALSPAGDPSVMAIVGLGGTRPAEPAPGEGGLHYLGEWKVFLAADGTVHLGDKDPSDFVALAGLVLSELQAIKTAFDSHVHTTTATVGAGATPGVISVPSNGATPAVPVPMPAPSSVASATVKCE